MTFLFGRRRQSVWAVCRLCCLAVAVTVRHLRRPRTARDGDSRGRRWRHDSLAVRTGRGAPHNRARRSAHRRAHWPTNHGAGYGAARGARDRPLIVSEGDARSRNREHARYN